MSSKILSLLYKIPFSSFHYCSPLIKYDKVSGEKFIICMQLFKIWKVIISVKARHVMTYFLFFETMIFHLFLVEKIFESFKMMKRMVWEFLFLEHTLLVGASIAHHDIATC